MNEIFVAMSDFSGVKNRMNRKSGVFRKFERVRGGVGVKFGRVGVRLKKGGMENGV